MTTCAARSRAVTEDEVDLFLAVHCTDRKAFARAAESQCNAQRLRTAGRNAPPHEQYQDVEPFLRIGSKENAETLRLLRTLRTTGDSDRLRSIKKPRWSASTKPQEYEDPLRVLLRQELERQAHDASRRKGKKR